MGKAYIIGTCDTKYAELDFVRQRMENAGLPCLLVDVGTLPHGHPADVPAKTVASFHPSRKNLLTDNEGRGDAVTAMGEALEAFLLSRNDLAGAIGLGGSGGTSLITRGLRALPVGVPKVMVSTVASGNTAPYVGASDLCMMYSVTDIAGINQISSVILNNAANALTGMMKGTASDYRMTKPALGMTMFGVTTPAVSHIRRRLDPQYDCLVFHATGTGGRSLEKLIDSGFIRHIIDLTTTEICDLLMGGVMSAGEDRMGAVIRQKIPYVASVGALDMVNFGAIDSVPEKYRHRLLYRHNEQVTLMRTTPEENAGMGKWIAAKLNRMEGPVRFLLPEKGVSALSVPGQPFHHPEADAALFETLEKELQQNERRRLIRLPFAINEENFANEVVEALLDIN